MTDNKAEQQLRGVLGQGLRKDGLPKVKWQTIDKMVSSNIYLFYGILNPGTDHARLGTFFAVWVENARHHLKDHDGDDLSHKPTHFLEVEYINKKP
jgi:hypothetical protein